MGAMVRGVTHETVSRIYERATRSSVGLGAMHGRKNSETLKMMKLEKDHSNTQTVNTATHTVGVEII